MARAKSIARYRYDPTEDWMPPVSALDLSRQAFYEAHPEQAPAYCPIVACGYRGTGPGRICPNTGNMIHGAYGSGLHGPNVRLLPGGSR